MRHSPPAWSLHGYLGVRIVCFLHAGVAAKFHIEGVSSHVLSPTFTGHVGKFDFSVCTIRQHLGIQPTVHRVSNLKAAFPSYWQRGQAAVVRLKVLAKRSACKGCTDHILVFYRKKGTIRLAKTFNRTTAAWPHYQWLRNAALNFGVVSYVSRVTS